MKKQTAKVMAVLCLMAIMGASGCKQNPSLNPTPNPTQSTSNPTASVVNPTPCVESPTPQSSWIPAPTTPASVPTTAIPMSVEEAFSVDTSWSIGIHEYHVQHLDTHIPTGYSINNGSNTAFDITIVPPVYGRRNEPVFSVLGGIFTESDVRGVVLDVPSLEKMNDYRLCNACPNLEFIWYKDMGSVKSIEAPVVSKCPNLRFIVIGDGVESVNMRIATTLQAIYLPPSVTDCGNVDPTTFRWECVIYGEAGSYAEEWAHGFGLTFVAVDECPLHLDLGY